MYYQSHQSRVAFIGLSHDDVMKWKHFPRYWPFVRGIHRSPANSPHKGQWRGALMFALIYVWINGWVNNREAGDLSRNRTHYDVIAMVNVDRIFRKHNITILILWNEFKNVVCKIPDILSRPQYIKAVHRGSPSTLEVSYCQCLSSDPEGYG